MSPTPAASASPPAPPEGPAAGANKPAGAPAPPASAPASTAATPGAATAAPAPPEGTLTVDDKALFESRVLAYEQMLRVTDRVADAIRGVHDDAEAAAQQAHDRVARRTYVVAAPADVEALQARAGVRAAVDALARAYRHVARRADAADGVFDTAREVGPNLKSLNPVAAAAGAAAAASPVAALGAAVGAVAQVVQAIGGLAAFFRRDVKIVNSDVRVDDAAVAAQIAGELAVRGLRVRTPGVYAPVRPAASDAADDPGDPYAALGDVYVEQDAAARRARAGSAEEQAVYAPRLAVLDDALKQLEAALLAGVGAPDAVAALRRAGALASALAAEGAFLVRVEVLASGGSRRETHRYALSTSLELSGGVVVNALVFAPDGTLAGGGTWPSHSGYVQFEARPRAVPA